ncbi:hypothetical protein M911_06505 [Ectothiorhodospira haloalkaliphila]|uniref:TIGR00341 family protein n=1 Tax=Ectothiorhodospira haloalkaliphila TaxID=421628 RepID=W8L4M2_9GAMM|nr:MULTISPECIES: TIGR00341 family protein [Ectothiorhodospira]AHK78865.1 hypothetical protein M911_06505 [Ectothiorhodospira haloalkaliphila]MCG5498060.1 TIGR00341 family protein [Ectothiorhodospira variabilis]
MRVVEVIAPARLQTHLLEMARTHGAVDAWCGTLNDDGRVAVRMVVLEDERQALLDALQSLLIEEPSARIVITPIEATVPMPAPGENDPRPERPRSRKVSLEELYAGIAKGATLDRNYLMLIVLSTVAAAIGLAEDNTAVVIGSMVIAPLLGPVIAFAFATCLGERSLALRSLATTLAGLTVTVACAMLIGYLWPVSVGNQEVLARTEVNISYVILALAAGAAGVLALTSGVTSRLVGVMVAVALLPPAAVTGLLVGKGAFDLALGAGLMLAANVVCVVLAAQFVFLFQGVKPRRWIGVGQVERFTPWDWVLWSLGCLLLLTGLVLAILWRNGAF